MKMWKDIEKPWQEAFEMAWEAYKTGINMAHAEMTAMMGLRETVF